MSRAQLTSTVEQNGAGAASPAAAGKNAISNGAFDIWQRGTSFSVGGTTYTADRFLVYAGGANVTIAQSTTIPSNGYSKYSLSITGATGNTTAQVFQRIESGISAAFNRTVTFSFKVYNNSGAASSPVIYVQTPNAVDNWATSANVISGVTLQSCPNGVWTTCSYTFNAASLSNIANGLGFVVDFGASSTLNSSSKSMNTTEWQLEAGAVATPFSRAGGTLQGELALCQRYYEHNYPAGYYPGSDIHSVLDTAQSLFATVANGGTAGSNRAKSSAWSYKVTKRTTPSSRCWDLLGNLSKYTAGDANGSQLTSNNSFDTYGAVQSTNTTSIGFETVTASSSHIYAMVMWEASAEL
jgi:hypothetical protein